jgi:uncharacterized membrane protein
MIANLILSIKHLLSAAIVVALLASTLASNWKKPFFGWMIAGTLAALVFAGLRRLTAISRGMVNAGLMLVSFLLSLAFLAVFVMPRIGFGFKKVFTKTTGTRAFAHTPAIVCALECFLCAGSLQNIFLMPGDIILPGQSAFTTETLLAFTGMVFGLIIIILMMASLYRTALTVKNNADLIWKIVVCAAVIINLIQSFAHIIQFLTARRIIRVGRGLFTFVAFILNNEMLVIFMMIAAALLLPLAALAISRRKRETDFENPAQKRKHRALLLHNLRWNALAIIAIIFAEFSLTALKAWNEKEVVLSPAEEMTLSDGEIIIPVAQIEDGHLHRFAWNASDGTEVRFIVIKKSISAYGVGFDACDICGNTGYYERKDGVVCRLCDVVMNKSTIGFKGGCNPVPLAYSIRDGNMIVVLADLEAEKGRFK